MPSSTNNVIVEPRLLSKNKKERIANKSENEIINSVKDKKTFSHSSMSSKASPTAIRFGSFLIISIAILFRLLVALHSYSGRATPPIFGDFEAQRHWMEITFHTPLTQWYRQTSNNDLKYWGLDYPPLSAYWAYITGYIANEINPSWVALFKSRGNETLELKAYMRLTVIISDIIVFMTGAFALSKRIPNFPKINLLVALLTPGLLLIDHGHFQYNNVMLGFTLWALVSFADRKYCRSVMFLFLSVCFKQMNIYSIPAFGAALLGIGLAAGNMELILFSYLKWGLTALATILICFAPFLQSKDLFLAVLSRLFPVNRGLFEEKVGNFWCSLAILTKFHLIRSNEQLFRYCLTSVATALVPIATGLIVKGAKKRLTIVPFLLGLSYTCLVMFLFSYHVHEKQILIPLLSMIFLSSHSPWLVCFFTLWSSFSLYPLMRKDELRVPYFCVLIVWNCFFYLAFKHKFAKISTIWKYLLIFSFDFVIIHHLAQALWTPPPSLPDLFLVLNTLSCSGAFCLIALYLLYQFWTH